MRESFITQYFEEQKTRETESVRKAKERQKQVDAWRAAHPDKKIEVKEEPIRISKRQRRKEKAALRAKNALSSLPRSLNHLVRQRLGKAIITNHTSFRDALRLLKFESYADYLKSALWKHVRARVFKVNGTQCFLCPKPADAVHHRKYTGLTLIGEHLHLLCPICNGCHRMIEFDVNGEKLASDDVEEYVVEHLARKEITDDEVSQEFLSMFR
jgi:hypothetical protein